MSVTLLREGGKYHRKCKLFKSFRDVSEMSIFSCHKTLTPLKFTRKNNLQTPCSLCKPRVDKVFKTFDKNSWELPR